MIYHPIQLPVMTAHGVGFKLPNVPLLTARRTSFSGAANMKFAARQPNRGQTYSRVISLAVGMAQYCFG